MTNSTDPTINSQNFENTNSKTPDDIKYPNKSIDGKDSISWEYKKRAIQSASPLTLIVMMYEEAIKSLESSKEYIDDFKTYDLFNKKLFKAIDIIKELRISLDLSQGKIAENLDSLYEYINQLLVDSGISKKKEPIDESIKLLEELLSSWEQLEENKDASLPIEEKPFSHFGGSFSIKG